MAKKNQSMEVPMQDANLQAEKYPNLTKLGEYIRDMQQKEGLLGMSFCGFPGTPADQEGRERMAGAICAMLELRKAGRLSRVACARF